MLYGEAGCPCECGCSVVLVEVGYAHVASLAIGDTVLAFAPSLAGIATGGRGAIDALDAISSGGPIIRPSETFDLDQFVEPSPLGVTRLDGRFAGRTGVQRREPAGAAPGGVAGSVALLAPAALIEGVSVVPSPPERPAARPRPGGARMTVSLGGQA
jgi:hypothetical protein